MMTSPLHRRFVARSVSLVVFALALTNFVWQTRRRSIAVMSSPPVNDKKENLLNTLSDRKVLYIVTSLSAMDTGKRSTTAGDDRFAHTVVPIVSASATSLAAQFAHVDVYLICHYTLNTTQWQSLRNALPDNVGLQTWYDATPLGYATEDEQQGVASNQRQIVPITRALARQHRYVMKDLLHAYDVFINFEDDMLLHGSQAQAYVDVTQDLYDLRQVAPVSLPKTTTWTDNPLDRFHGPMTKIMLSRLLPGWIRVEHVGEESPPTTKHQFQQIPVTLTWPDTSSSFWQRLRGTPRVSTVQLDPAPCCRMPYTTTHIPTTLPRIQDLYFWETSIEALALRHMPTGSKLGWVILQPGGDDQYLADVHNFGIGEYWTGRASEYFDNLSPITLERPDRLLGNYMNNQGGWMATKRQVLEWHRLWCRGSLLPPYDAPAFVDDGLAKIIVEYWSGGFQLAGLRACNLHRLVPLDPDRFAQFLLYHTSNNKQHQKYVRHRFYGRNVQDFWGQLNTIRLSAEKTMMAERRG